MSEQHLTTITLPPGHAFTEELAIAAVREILAEEWQDYKPVWSDEGFADAHCWQRWDEEDRAVDYVRVLNLYDGRIGFQTEREDLAGVFKAWAYERS